VVVRILDRSRPFGEERGETGIVGYEQDGFRFDRAGKEVNVPETIPEFNRRQLMKAIAAKGGKVNIRSTVEEMREQYRNLCEG